MSLPSRLRVWARSWLRAREIDDELGEELRFHLERQIEANLAAGMSPEAARRAARLVVGGFDQIQEESREARPGALFRQLGRDLGYGLRLMGKSPGFAAAATGIVALGIGAVTAIFSVVYGVALRPLPYTEPDRLVSLWTSAPRLRLPRALVAVADARDWEAASQTLGEIALVRPVANFNLVGDGEPERLQGARVAPSLFRVLGVTPALGRPFTDQEGEIGNEGVVLLSHGLWNRRFAGDPGIVGREISLSGKAHRVVGVMRPDFAYPAADFQVWTPLTLDPDEVARKETPYNYRAVARLEPGAAVAQAQSELDAIAKRLEAAYPNTNREVGVRVEGMLEGATRSVRPALYALLGAVGCLLLIACLNLANLLAARAARRQREFAVRLALGASRGRLILQALAEVAPLLALGGALGLAGAGGALRVFVPLAPEGLPRIESVALSAPVLALSAGALALTGLLGALLPAVQAWGTDLQAASRGEGRGAAGSRHGTQARRFLTVAQIALTLPLLVGAGLLFRSFSALAQVDPGFRADNVLSLHLAIPRSKYPGDPEVAAFGARLLDRVAQVPGVASAGMVNRLPLGGVGQMGSLEVENPASGDGRIPGADWRSVTPSYFQTLGIPLLEGRTFSESDDAAAPAVGIVDEQLAQSAWPGQSALGKRFRIPFPGLPWTEVVGVVGHLRHEGLDVDPRAQVYWSYRQRTQDRMVLVVRSRRDAGTLGPEIVAAIRAVDPEQPVYNVRTMTDVVQRSLAPRRLSLALVAAFAVAALLLASVGVYGVIAFGVAQRVREFGIRMALGAEGAAVTRLVLREGVTLAALGTLLGLVVALVLGGLIEGLLFGVQPRDALSTSAAALLLLGVAVLASYLPARRAAGVDPTVALRCD